MERKVPIYNIYYMLCYVWDALEEKNVVKVNVGDYETMIELFTKILISGTQNLIHKGLDRGYINKHEELQGIKGKIDFKTSLSNLSFSNAKSYCHFDDFSPDILHNQILKTTLIKLLNVKVISNETKDDILNTCHYLNDVNTISITPQSFKMVILNRNNHYYKFLLSICELIHNNLKINENDGLYEFMDFFEEDKKLSALFENFVRKFYEKELNRKFYYVKKEKIQWDLDKEPNSTEDLKVLPKMETDISIIEKKTDKTLIIDTKFYKNLIAENQYGGEKLKSPNLYQIFAYVKNTKRKNTEGMLLYPTLSEEHGHEYQIQGSKISIKTVNLGSENWQCIKNRLLSFI